MGLFALIVIGYVCVVLVALLFHGVREALAFAVIYALFVWGMRRSASKQPLAPYAPSERPDVRIGLRHRVDGHVAAERHTDASAATSGLFAMAVTARPGRDGLPRTGYAVYADNGDMHAFVDGLSGGIPYLRSVFPGIPVVDTITVTAAQFNELRDWSDASGMPDDDLPF